MSRDIMVLLRWAWLVGIPLMAAYTSYPTSPQKGLSLDTSAAAAAKIRPGMTIAQVEQIIGGPAGTYLYPEDIQPRFICGNNFPNTIEWVTYDGKIVVTDGMWGFGGARDTEFGTTLDSWSTAKGTVDSVRWEPCPPSKAKLGDFWGMVGGSFIFALLSLWLVHAACGGPETLPHQPNPHLETT
jgi:hypothetical protein